MLWKYCTIDRDPEKAISVVTQKFTNATRKMIGTLAKFEQLKNADKISHQFEASKEFKNPRSKERLKIELIKMLAPNDPFSLAQINKPAKRASIADIFPKRLPVIQVHSERYLKYGRPVLKKMNFKTNPNQIVNKPFITQHHIVKAKSLEDIKECEPRTNYHQYVNSNGTISPLSKFYIRSNDHTKKLHRSISQLVHNDMMNGGFNIKKLRLFEGFTTLKKGAQNN